MGGSSKKSSSKTEEPKVTTSTVPAFMPGWDSMIAQQLGQGGYGDPNAILAQMQAVQKPNQIPSMGYSPTTPNGTPPTSTATPKNPLEELFGWLNLRGK